MHKVNRVSYIYPIPRHSQVPNNTIIPNGNYIYNKIATLEKAYPFLALNNINLLRLNASSEDNLIRVARQVDLESAADSGYGHSSYSSGYGKSEYYCPEGIPVETALFALLAAAGLSFGILFMAITMITGAKRRKKRQVSSLSIDGLDQNDASPLYSVMFNELIWEGML